MSKRTLFSFSFFLPPAYVVRREGTVFTGVCLSTGGGGGVRVPPRGGTRSGTPPGGSYFQALKSKVGYLQDKVNTFSY